MRSAQRQYSSANNLRVLPAIIFIIFLAVVGFVGFQLYKDSRFGKFDRLNVALATNPLALLSVNIAEHSAVVVRLPDDLYIAELAFGYGPYKAATIYSVGQLDKRGGETVGSTLSDYLGIPVDGYIHTPGQLPKDIKGFFLNPQNLFNIQSNLNLYDRLRLAMAVLQMRFDKINTVDLSKLSGELVLADGSKALSLDKEILDNSLGSLFVEKRLLSENYRVEVINSTHVVGLGNRAGRILANIGSNVVNVGTISLPLPNCQIQATSKAKSSITVVRIAQIFSCQVLDNSSEGRADVVVTIGEDYAKKLGKE